MAFDDSRSATIRVRLEIIGIVQGVGFRPTVAQLAHRHGLGGFVYNDSGAVYCELEGAARLVEALIDELETHPPPAARIDEIKSARVACLGERSFYIAKSRTSRRANTIVPPDTATCAECVRELRDVTNRRHGHPFITCTNCGPRYTVITGLPYDRPSTTMARFPMCAQCAVEYRDPSDRRYHAQTIACPECGPTLAWSGPGNPSDPISAAASALEAGLVVAVKGIGGYHLACRADDDASVRRLRRRKSRPDKPFAVMVADLDSARRVAIVSDAAAALLASSAAPIVLVPARGNLLSTEVAPRLREVGVVLGYSPIHHLLFERLDNVPLVMTSANQGGSPIAFREGDLEFVIGLAEGILTHDRPIHIACEDSVLTIDHSGSPLPIRRSRGYVPLPVKVPTPGGREAAVLATGGDLKTTFCLMGEDGQAHISSHLGDMADIRTQDRFGYEYRHLSLITDRRATIVAHDAHPGYATTGWARRQDVPLVAVQHHHAHAVSLLAEHDRIGTRMLAVAFDGTGYGTDGSLWGGELLLISNDPGTFTRVGGLTSFSLPGGDGAVRQPARVALDLLHRNDLPWDCQLAPVRTLGPDRIVMLKRQLARGIGCVPTSSMGRLFDAVASLLDVCQQVTYEGQAAIELENLAYTGTPHNLSFATCGGALDPGPVIAGLVTGLRMGVDRADLAAGFQAAVVRATVRVVMECALSNDVATVGLTGGVFVNRTLLSGVRDGLRNTGFEVLVHQMLPCNDGGLALGQAVIAAGHLG